jgi:hypothetical protein
VKFSSVVSIQIFSVKNANPSFYAKCAENDYFPLPSKFEMDDWSPPITYFQVAISYNSRKDNLHVYSVVNEV